MARKCVTLKMRHDPSYPHFDRDLSAAVEKEKARLNRDMGVSDPDLILNSKALVEGLLEQDARLCWGKEHE